MTENPSYDQIITQIISIFIEHKLNIDMIYFFLNQYLCFHAKTIGKSLDQIKSDVEIIFNSLPPPIEETDDNTDIQPNCQGT